MKDEVVRRTGSLRKPSGKKPGGQKGHDGHKLSCSSVPDETIDEVPDYCTRCGESLSDSERVLDYVTQGYFHSRVEARNQGNPTLCDGMQELW